jgi:hypothetical protein
MKKNEEKTMLTEQVFEARHEASGTFLDVRGFVADYIRNLRLFPHWNIDANKVQFKDARTPPYKDAASISYKNFGYTVFDSPTKNYFQEKTSKFWNALRENKHYEIPKILRVGIRTKAFFPLSRSFEEIRDKIYEKFFTQDSHLLVSKSIDDLQLVIDYKEEEFKVYLRGGSIKKEEAKNYFSFEAKEFQENGLFLDIDYFKTENINHNDISNLIIKATDMTWKRLETIARGMGF